MKTLKLTRTDDTIIYINFYFVSDFFQSGNETILYLNSIDYFIKVKESAEEIFKNL